MRLVNISLINGQNIILNMENVSCIRFYAEDSDGDCELVINGERKMGYVHGQSAADKILKGIFELGDKNSIAFDKYGDEIAYGNEDLWSV